MTMRIFVPRDAGAVAVGADEVATALEWAAAKAGIAVEIVRTGSRGLYWLEPMVEVATSQGRVAFGPVTAADVPTVFDAMTAGGRGIPLLWPVSFHRFEIPWQPIPDAPCGLAYLSLAGLRVASIEFFQFLPVLLLALRPPAPVNTPVTATAQETATPSVVRQGNAAPGRASITRQVI
jgi:hypothetical protein